MSILPQTHPDAAPTLASRIRSALQGFRAAALDAAAFLGGAADHQALALEADAIHDLSLGHLMRVAALGAEEADLRGCGCAGRFDRVIRLGQDAQRYDAIEDGEYGLGFRLVDRGVARIQVVAGSADRMLSGGPR